MTLTQRPGFGPYTSIFSEHPLPWTFDSEPEEEFLATDDEDTRMTKAYSCEPVVRDAKGQLVLDTRSGSEQSDGLGAYGRILFAEWIVAKANEEVTA